MTSLTILTAGGLSLLAFWALLALTAALWMGVAA